MKVMRDIAADDPAESFLLVPVALEAMLAGSTDLNGNWSWGQMSFSNMGNPPSDPDPGSNYSMPQDVNGQTQIDGRPAPVGATLHWALPDAITHGITNTNKIEDANQDIVYPFVPNRWLILRMYADSATTPSLRATKSWILESDHLNPTTGSNSFPDPSSNVTDGPPKATMIGRAIEAERWAEPGMPNFFLHALGPGSPTYAAFAPNVNNVLSFYDDLSDVTSATPNTPVEISYLVCGWYSDPQGDPLSLESKTANQPQWQQFINQCNWSVDGKPIASPARILCHGMVVFPTTANAGNNIPWSGIQSTSYIPPTPSDIQVAVGNCAVEAISALVEAQLQLQNPQTPDTTRHVEKLFEAFQLSLTGRLDEAGGQDVLARQIHQAGFGSKQGGSRWNLIPKAAPKDSTPTTAPAVSSIAPHAAAVQLDGPRELLATLNQTQQKFDALERRLVSLQTKLYALWWQKITVNDPDNLDAPAPTGYYDGAVAALETQIQQLQKTLYDNSTGLSALIETQKANVQQATDDKLDLVEEKMPRFWRAADPVLLISGAGRTYDHGEDGRFNEDGNLACRLATETISTLTIPGGSTTGATVTSADLNLSVPAVGPAAAEITALALEAYLLDSRNAPALAALPKVQQTGVTAAAIATQQGLPWNAVAHPELDAHALQTQSGFNGVIPSKVAFTIWSSSWSPLFLDWNISWWPTSTDPTQVLEGWTAGDYDYSYGGTTPTTQAPLTFMGRTLLTPHVTRGLQTCLENFAQGDMLTEVEADFDKFIPGASSSTTFQDLVNALSNWDVLSQSLGGLTDLIVQQQRAYLLPPYDPNDANIGSTVGGMHTFLPFNLGPAQTGEFPLFHPVRAGYFQLTSNLRVINRFGQAVDVLNNTFPYPVRAGSLDPNASATDNQNLVYLPPRLAQHSRLLFQLLSAADDTKDLDTYPAESPICGWVLPNHLDGVLAVFDAAGASLGQLVTVDANPPWVRWDPVPGTNAPLGAPPNLSNQYLQQFVESLLVPNLDGGNALAHMLEVIDSTLWTVDPLGARSNENLSVLIGRPLAIVRAQLRFELDGDPITELSWPDWDQDPSDAPPPLSPNLPPPAWVSLHVPVWLGDLRSGQDGLVGFFRDDEIANGVFESFHALQPIPTGETDTFIDTNNNVQIQPQLADVNGVLPPGKMLTMLVDPRGGIYQRSGILPADRLLLPTEHIKDALAAMTVTFRTGPLLCDPAIVRMPLPSGINGNWSWIHRPGVTTWQEVTDIKQGNDQARFPDARAEISEGWLKLGGAMGESK